MSTQAPLPRRIAFHPLSCAKLGVVRRVLRQDKRFRLSHLGPLIAALATNIQRRPYFEKTRVDVAATPDDWHRATPPVFVVGFWRSGTTLLQEMLAADRAFASPRLMDILFPSDARYLIRHKRKAMGAIARVKTDEKGAPPRITRMVDLVEVSLERPQEEELAICHLAAPSFFRASFFPRDRDAHIEEALFAPSGSPARQAWREAHALFSKTLVAKYKGLRLLLKNPANSTRIDELQSLYPDAMFVRIDRDREQVLKSFVRMMNMSIQQFSLQGRSKPYTREEAEALYRRVMEKLDADWANIAPERKAAISYETLTANPVAAVGPIYAKLGLARTKEAAQRQKRLWNRRVRHWSPKTDPAASLAAAGVAETVSPS